MASKTFFRLFAATALTVGALATAVPASAQGVSGPYLAAEHAAKRGDILGAARYFSEALAKDPSNAALLENTILHQVAAGRISTAVALAKRLDEIMAGHHLALMTLTAEGLHEGRAAEVRARLDAVEKEGMPFVGELIRAWATFGDGDPEAGRQILTAIEDAGVGGQGGKIVSAYHQALMSAAAGDDATAVADFERAGELGSTPTLRLVRLHAGALARLGRADEAADMVRERLNGLLGDPRLEALLSDLDAGKAPEPVVSTAAQGAAEALFGVSGFLSQGPNAIVGIAYSRLAAWLDPELVEAKLLIAEMLFEQEQYALAGDAYAEIRSDAPEALEAMIGRAQALEADGDLDFALDMLRETTKRFPDDIEATTALGDMLRRAERFGEAAEAYDGAVGLIRDAQTRHWVLYYQRGIAYERSDQWDKAEKDFRRALELQPGQPLVLNYLGYSFVELGRNLNEAEEMIEQAVEQRPEDGFIVDSLGWVQFRRGDFEDAVVNLERAVELEPVDPVINDHYGDALWMVGRRTEARFQWKRALSFEPEDDEAVRIRRKLAEGLDTLLAEEEAEGKPTIFTRDEASPQEDGG